MIVINDNLLSAMPLIEVYKTMAPWYVVQSMAKLLPSKLKIINNSIYFCHYVLVVNGPYNKLKYKKRTYFV